MFRESSKEVSQNNLLQPIPELPPIVGWKEVPLQPSSEPLVALGLFSENDDIFTSAIYAAEYSDSPYEAEVQIDDSLLTMFVRTEVAKKLRHAQQLLPAGYHLVVYDSYRPLTVQQSLYNQYLEALKKQKPDWSNEMLEAETQKYVSIPSIDQTRPSPHNTGGSVDVAIFNLPDDIQQEIDAIENRLSELQLHIPKTYTAREEVENPFLREFYLLNMKRTGLVKSHASVLDFGTAFDNGTNTSALRYYEELSKTHNLSDAEQQASSNRRLLYNAMSQAGMVGYEEEWWHFNAPESQMGAKVAGLPFATYGAEELSVELQEHETLRRRHHEGFRLIADNLRRGVRFRSYNGLQNDLMALNEDAAVGSMADPHMTSLPEAAIISPEENAA